MTLRRTLAAVAALLLCGVLYVALVGFDIDMSALRPDISAKFLQATGRALRIDGPLRLEISAHPGLRINGLHVANAQGYGASEFASLGEAHLQLDLWPLLWGRMRIDELAGSEVQLHLQQQASGSNNWRFGAPVSAQPTAATAPSNGDLALLLGRFDIRRVALQKLDLDYTGADGKAHYFNLDSLVASLPIAQPLTLHLNGTVEKRYPYQLDFSGARLSDLAHPERPWPVALTLRFMSSHLALQGNAASQAGQLHFELASDDLGEFERLLQTSLPPLGSASIAGDIDYAPGKIRLSHLDGKLGKSTLQGALAFDYSAARPSLQGQLTLPVLDLRPFMTGKPTPATAVTPGLADLYHDIAAARFQLHELKQADVDLSLRVGQWLNLPGEVRDAKLQVKLDHGHLSMPLQATVADVPLSGDADVDASITPPRFRVTLGAHNSNLGGLGGLLLGVHGVKGQLGRLDLRMAARGDRGSELIRSLDLRLQVTQGKLSYGTDAHPVRLALDDLLLALPAGHALHGAAHGALLDTPFSMNLSGATLSDLMQENAAPVDFSLLAGSARAQLHALLQAPTSDAGTQASFELDAPHAREVAGWLGLQPGSDVPVNLHGDFHSTLGGWHLSDFVLSLGHSSLSADVQNLQWQGKPLVRLQITSNLIDAEELQHLLPQTVDDPRPAPHTAPAATLDIPILPNGISLSDADITVRIQRVTSASPFPVRDLSFDGSIRNGVMQPSPFAANLAGSDFKGKIGLDLRSAEPSAELRLTALSLDAGQLLDKLDLAHHVDAHFDRLHLHLDLHASRLGQLLARSVLRASSAKGYIDLHDAYGHGTVHIAVDDCNLKSEPGSPVQLDLHGALDGVPLSIGIRTASAPALLAPTGAIPFSLQASAPAASLQLSGDIQRPLAQQDVTLALSMQGDRLDNLNALAHASLPPWGPWSASGKFHMSAQGYEVPDLRLRIGSSELGGRGKFDALSKPPHFDVALSAPTIQLDDFRFGNWSPEVAAQTASPNTRPPPTNNNAAQLLSRSVLQRQNAHLTLHVGQVLSGKDVLGSGHLEAQLKDGRADIGPIVVDTPGGSATLHLLYEPEERDVALQLLTQVHHFDYGILARHMNKGSKLSGIFDLDVDVSARAQSLAELMRYGKGHVDFALWPQNMNAGALDLWAVNVIMALLPAVDPANTSRVNCAIARFDLDNGNLVDKKILIDTTRMRVTGKGAADFATQQLQFDLQPHAKTPQFLSFAIPIELSGRFDDYHIGVRPLDVLGEIAQLATSVIWVPLQTLFGMRTPADGKDVCESTG